MRILSSQYKTKEICYRLTRVDSCKTKAFTLETYRRKESVTLFFLMAGAAWVEQTLRPSKSPVLPLDEAPLNLVDCLGLAPSVACASRFTVCSNAVSGHQSKLSYSQKGAGWSWLNASIHHFITHLTLPVGVIRKAPEWCVLIQS